MCNGTDIQCVAGPARPAAGTRDSGVDLGVGKAGARLSAAFGIAAIVNMVGGFYIIAVGHLTGARAYESQFGQFYLAAGLGPALIFFANRLPEILRLLVELRHGGKAGTS